MRIGVLLAWSALAASSACRQSLFSSIDDADGGTGGDGAIATTCPAPCLGDAGGDFDGTASGGGRWRYLEDNRDRTWTPMTPAGGGMAGQDPMTSITTCAALPSTPSCAALPGALLISAAGSSAASDPAVEFTAEANAVISIQLAVAAPAGSGGSAVRLYRNSREDSLFNGVVTDGVLSATLEVDALAGDRFLVAIVPGTTGIDDVAVQLFVSGTTSTFPEACQTALTFSAASGVTVVDQCSATPFTYRDYDVNIELAPPLGSGPFPEMGSAADIPMNQYFVSSETIDATGDVTVQMWVRHDAFISGYVAWLFSTLDLDLGGGLSLDIYDTGSGLILEALTCTVPDPNVTIDGITAAYPNDHAWHFVRVVHSNGNLSLCLDGTRVGQRGFDSIASSYEPKLGSNLPWPPDGAFFDGGIDDVRILSTALPCQ